MALNDSTSAKVKRASKEEAAKRALETNLTRRMNAIFRKMAIEFQNALANFDGAINVAAYQPIVQATLVSHYNKSAKAFSREILNYLKSIQNQRNNPITNELKAIADLKGLTYNQLIRQIQDRAADNFRLFRDQQTRASATSIIETTQKRMTTSTIKAENNLRESLDTTPTQSQVAKAAKADFLGRSLTHSRTIAATETQNATEATKELERQGFNSVYRSPEAASLELEPRVAVATWLTRADSKVRDGDGTPFNHLAADGQDQVNGVFTVSGELLRFPGDRSLGASRGNTINCRCSAVTSLD